MYAGKTLLTQLMDILPRITFGASSDNFGLFRWEPHPTDPEKCYFDLWSMVYPVEGQNEIINRTARNPLKFEEAEFDFRDYDNGQGVRTYLTRWCSKTGN